MILLRRLLGDVLRRQRQRQGRTLREVSSSARVSLGYLSEVERGQKEASSELLSAICDALDVRMSELMREVSDELALAELAESAAAGETAPVREPVPAVPGVPAVPAGVRPMLNSVSVTGVPPERVTIKAPAEAVDVVAA
ncbi:helix-turn-helix domain-containing protein [Streptomyces sp. Da 82-17]|uniref:helix-turn-helix domain-containing protein n=1 Tax=Streptomyces sp. Da 82-17 TaxID=3377116 RepID=UPI0038D3AB26